MNRNYHFAGVSGTVLLHLGFIGLLLARYGWGGGEAEARSDRFKNAETIEAALAYKKVEKKSRQPQKKKKKKFKPKSENKISRDAEKDPVEKKDDESLPPKPDEVDVDSVLKKNRTQDPDLSSTGAEELPQEGSESGSEWGTEKEAFGDPYVGELKGRIYKAWEVPSLETGAGNALGCVKLDEDGTILEREVVKKSSNANLNRSVYLALKESTDMDKPVPEHLKTLLTERGICFKFVLE